MNSENSNKQKKYLIMVQDGAICRITLNRPEKANAYNQLMLKDLEKSIDQFEEDNTARVLIITGSGEKAFSAGADLKEMHGKTYQSALDLKSAQIFLKLSKLKKITIAAINGAAYGGGFELALSCDLRLCNTSATFSFPETDLGLIPAAGGTQRLAQIVGKSRAKEMILGGMIWDADQSLNAGLVSKVVAIDDLLSEANSWAKKIASRNALALCLAKQAIDLNQNESSGLIIESLSEALLYELKKNKPAQQK